MEQTSTWCCSDADYLAYTANDSWNKDAFKQIIVYWISFAVRFKMVESWCESSMSGQVQKYFQMKLWKV